MVYMVSREDHTVSVGIGIERTLASIVNSPSLMSLQMVGNASERLMNTHVVMANRVVLNFSRRRQPSSSRRVVHLSDELKNETSA